MTNILRMGAALRSATALGLLGAVCGCNGVLGIEHATFDPDASSDGAGASDATEPDGSTGQSSDATADGGELTCANYCSTIMQNCTGVNQEYLSNKVCMTLCSYMQVGVYYPPASEPDNVDTLGCRLWHANVAPTNPTVHCRHAGPMGTELCGGPCEPFCSLDWHFCTDDNGIAVYDGQVPGCESFCEGDAGFDYVEGDSGDITDPTGNMIDMGNTLNCRLWHLETAIDLSEPIPHCTHTGITSATCQ